MKNSKILAVSIVQYRFWRCVLTAILIAALAAAGTSLAQLMMVGSANYLSLGALCVGFVGAQLHERLFRLISD